MTCCLCTSTIITWNCGKIFWRVCDFFYSCFCGNLISVNRPKPVTTWNSTPVDRKWHGWHRKCASYCLWPRLMCLFLFTEIYDLFFPFREKQNCIISSVFYMMCFLSQLSFILLKSNQQLWGPWLNHLAKSVALMFSIIHSLICHVSWGLYKPVSRDDKKMLAGEPDLWSPSFVIENECSRAWLMTNFFSEIGHDMCWMHCRFKTQSIFEIDIMQTRDMEFVHKNV